jgi:hypothetical protein
MGKQQPTADHSGLVKLIADDYYKGQHHDKIANKIMASEEAFTKALELVRKKRYAKVDSADFVAKYTGKYGNPFAQQEQAQPEQTQAEQVIPQEQAVSGDETAPSAIPQGLTNPAMYATQEHFAQNPTAIMQQGFQAGADGTFMLPEVQAEATGMPEGTQQGRTIISDYEQSHAPFTYGGAVQNMDQHFAGMKVAQPQETPDQREGFLGAAKDVGSRFYNSLVPGLVNTGGNVVEFLGDAEEMRQGRIPMDDKWSDKAADSMRGTAKDMKLDVSEKGSESILENPTSARAWFGTIAEGVGTLGQIAGATALGGPGAGIAVGGSLGLSGVYDAADEAGISDGDKVALGSVLSPVIAGLEQIGMGKIASNPAVLRTITKEIIKKAGKDLSAKGLVKAASEVIPVVVKNNARTFGSGALGEAATEGAQSGVQGGAEIAYDATIGKGKEKGDGNNGRLENGAVEAAKTLGKEVLVGSAVGGIIGGVAGNLSGQGKVNTQAIEQELQRTDLQPAIRSILEEKLAEIKASDPKKQTDEQGRVYTERAKEDGTVEKVYELTDNQDAPEIPGKKVSEDKVKGDTVFDAPQEQQAEPEFIEKSFTDAYGNKTVQRVRNPKYKADETIQTLNPDGASQAGELGSVTNGTDTESGEVTGAKPEAARVEPEVPDAQPDNNKVSETVDSTPVEETGVVETPVQQTEVSTGTEQAVESEQEVADSSPKETFKVSNASYTVEKTDDGYKVTNAKNGKELTNTNHSGYKSAVKQYEAKQGELTALEARKGMTPEREVKAGKKTYLVDRDTNGVLRVKDKNGKLVPKTSNNYKKAVESFKEAHIEDFMQGQEANTEGAKTEQEYHSGIIAESENAAEVATHWLSLEDTPLDYKTEVIRDNLRYTTQQSYRRNGDINGQEGRGQIKLNYIRKDGTPLDVQAEEMSVTAGITITEGDLIEFIDNNPGGQQTVRPVNHAKEEAAQKFHQLTGFEIDDAFAGKLRDAYFAKLTDNQPLNPSHDTNVSGKIVDVSPEMDKFLSHEKLYNEDNSINLEHLSETIKDQPPLFFTAFPYSLSDAEYQQLKDLTNERTTKQGQESINPAGQDRTPAQPDQSDSGSKGESKPGGESRTTDKAGVKPDASSPKKVTFEFTDGTTRTGTIVSKNPDGTVNIKGDKGRTYSNIAAASTEPIGKTAQPQLQSGRTMSQAVSTRVKQLTDRIKKAFPKLDVVSDAVAFEAAAIAKGVPTDINGFFHEGKVYINPNTATLETPIHEFGHVWLALAKEVNRPLYNLGIKLIRDTAYHAEVNANPDYDTLSASQKLDEALAQAVGEKGVRILESSSKFKNWLNKVWDLAKRAMKKAGIDVNPRISLTDTSLDQFTTQAAKEILGETPLSDVTPAQLAAIENPHLGRKGNIVIDNSVLTTNPKGVWQGKLKPFFGKWLTSHSGAGIGIRNMKETALHRMQARLSDVDFAVVDFQKAIASYVEKAAKEQGLDKAGKEKLMNDVLLDVNDALRGTVDANGVAKSIFNLPEGLREPANQMRNKIDALTQQLLRDKIVEGDKIEATLNQNMGVYLNRSYRMHDVQGFAEKVEKYIGKDAYDAAIDFINKEYGSSKVRRIRVEQAKDGSFNVVYTNKAGVESNTYNYTTLDDVAAELGLSQGQKKTLTDGWGGATDGVAEITLSKNHDQNAIPFTLTQEQARDIVAQILDIDNFEAIAGRTKLGELETSVLYKRKDIAPQIRALMGEYLDPRVNAAKSLVKMTQLAEGHRFDMQVLAEGEGTWLSTKGKTETHTKQLTKKESKLFGDETKFRNGVWVTPEVYEAFYGKGIQNQDGVIKALAYFSGLTKAGLTIYKDDSQARNFWGAALNMLATGNFKAMGNVVEAARIASQDFTTGQERLTIMSSPLFITKLIAGKSFGNSGKPELRDKFLRAKELGLLGQNTEIGAVKDMVEMAYTDITGESKRAKVKKFLAADMPNAFAKPYQLSDAIFKVAQWMSEVKNLAKQFPNKSQEQLEQEAAKIVLDTQPAYERAPKAVKAISATPYVGSFVMFQYSMFTTTRNIVKLGAKEIREGNKTGNKAMVASGVTRMASLIGATSLSLMLGQMSKALLGVEDEEDEAIAHFHPSYSEHNTRVYMSKDLKNPKYLDFSFINPRSMYEKAMWAALRGDDVWDKTFGAGNELVDPFTSPEIFTAAVMQAVRNKDDYDRKIANESYSGAEQAGKRLWHVTKNLVPGFVNTPFKVAAGAMDYTTDYGKVYNMWDEVANSRVGIKVKEREMSKAVVGKLRGHKMKIQEALEIYKDSKDSGEVSLYSDDDRKEQSQKKFREYMEQTLETVNKAKVLGFTQKDLYLMLKDAGFNEDQRGMLISDNLKIDALIKMQEVYQPYPKKPKLY